MLHKICSKVKRHIIALRNMYRMSIRSRPRSAPGVHIYPHSSRFLLPFRPLAIPHMHSHMNKFAASVSFTFLCQFIWCYSLPHYSRRVYFDSDQFFVLFATLTVPRARSHTGSRSRSLCSRLLLVHSSIQLFSPLRLIFNYWWR